MGTAAERRRRRRRRLRKCYAVTRARALSEITADTAGKNKNLTSVNQIKRRLTPPTRAQKNCPTLGAGC